ncbi:MAG TPA: clan AA aspartic protease [Candidatus Nanoarchaeia archaeon]|nr:clan AA aspartic protease [Candidatus Nanoarchaeia archaeon]
MNGFFESGSPFIELFVEKRKINLLLDTGFNGHLMLPSPVIQELGLDAIGLSDYRTASGDRKITRVYSAEIHFMEEKIEIPVLSTDVNIFLAGMELFDNCKIVVERKKNTVEVIKSK